MQYQKTRAMSAGVRAPNTVTIDPTKKAGPSGSFAFLDANTVKLDLDSGKSVLLFVSKGYTYAEVKPLEDALTAELSAAGIQVGDAADDDDDEGAPAPVEAKSAPAPLDGILTP
jgi:hypothetical protein